MSFCIAFLEGAYLGLVLELSLPFPGTIGTMALREILKMDMTANLRMKHLRENELGPRQQHSSPLATKRIFEESQMKKTNENPCTTDQPLSEISKSFLDTNGNRPESAAKIQDRSPSTSESRVSQLKGITLEPAIFENLPPATRETEELQKNQIILELRTCQRSQPTVNGYLKEPQTNVKKEQPGISQTHSSKFIESCEEPVEKKIKIDHTTNTEEVSIIQPIKVSKFKSIIYIDLTSDQED